MAWNADLPYRQATSPRRGGEEYSEGAYGRDGAPASKFMGSLPQAHRPQQTQRPNIAPVERPLPPAARFSPSPTRSPSPPAYAGSPDLRADLKISAPKAAFLEPNSPTSRNFDSHSAVGLVHGETEKAQVIRDDQNTSGVMWHDLEKAKADGSSSWLAQQSQAGSKFKIVTWIVAVFVLIIIGVSIERAIVRKPTLANPHPLSWANGSSAQPTFGVNKASEPKQSTTAASSSTQGAPTRMRHKRSIKLPIR